MNKIKKDAGFSLVELMVAVAISGIVITGVFTAFTTQHKSYVIQEQVSNTQQNLRIAKENMLSEIRMAGSRVAKDIGIIPFNSTNSPDIINIVYGDPSFPTMEMQSYSVDSLSVNGNQGSYISVGDISMLSLGNCSVLISVAGVSYNGYQTIITYSPISQSPSSKTPPDFPYGFAGSVIDNINCRSNWAGAILTKPVFRSYSIDIGTNTLLQTTYFTNGTPAMASPLANDVTDLQIVYVLNTQQDSIRYDGAGVDPVIFDPGVSAQQDLIREVRFYLLARTTLEDDDWVVGVRPPVLGDYNYAGGSPDPNDENYRWRLIAVNSFIRNLGF